MGVCFQTFNRGVCFSMDAARRTGDIAATLVPPLKMARCMFFFRGSANTVGGISFFFFRSPANAVGGMSSFFFSYSSANAVGGMSFFSLLV